jgi:AcrR family transcriptional regulator
MSPPPSPGSEPLRHLPQQARSQERFNRILEAAAQVFAEVGYEKASTEAIATRASTSIGSLYRFFPDKSAILYALAEAYAEQLREVLARAFDPASAHLPLAQVIYRAVDDFEQFYVTQPGYQVVFAQTRLSPDLQSLDKRLDSEIALHLEKFLAARQSTLSPEQIRLVALISVETAGSLQILSLTQNEAFRQQVMAETKTLLIRYLHPLFPDSPPIPNS